jgi:hypothetical protein
VLSSLTSGHNHYVQPHKQPERVHRQFTFGSFDWFVNMGVMRAPAPMNPATQATPTKALPTWMGDNFAPGGAERQHIPTSLNNKA